MNIIKIYSRSILTCVKYKNKFLIFFPIYIYLASLLADILLILHILLLYCDFWVRDKIKVKTTDFDCYVIFKYLKNSVENKVFKF